VESQALCAHCLRRCYAACIVHSLHSHNFTISLQRRLCPLDHGAPRLSGPYDLPIAWNLASSLMMGCGRFLKTYFCEMTATTSYTGGWPSSIVGRFAMTANGFLSGATLPSNLCWPNVRTALPYRPTNTQPAEYIGNVSAGETQHGVPHYHARTLGCTVMSPTVRPLRSSALLSMEPCRSSNAQGTPSGRARTTICTMVAVGTAAAAAELAWQPKASELFGIAH